MDVCEALKRLHKRREAASKKQPVVTVEKNNGPIIRPSRCKSPTPSVSKRCASPDISRTVNASTQLAPKRAVSAERRRPSTPPSLSRPTTPVHDTSVELQSRRVTSSKLPESLWPSTMRSLSVSFQSDSISVPVSKKEKPVSHALSDRTLRQSSNVAQKQPETANVLRKSTPEWRRSPLKGKNSSDQAENSKPVDGLRARLIDQHRWPSRAGGTLSSQSLTKSVDLSDKVGRSFGLKLPSTGVTSLRRLSAEGISRPLQKSTSDSGGSGPTLIDEIKKAALNMKAVDDTVLRVSKLHKLNFSKSPGSPSSGNAAMKSISLPGSRLPSPSKASASRGMASPSRSRPSTPTSSRGTSPSRIRPSSPTRLLSSATSVLSFVSDLKKVKKSTNQLEDAHHLRLLYNRYLQWRFANAQADAAMHIQRILAEETLYNVWRATLELWDSVIMKRIDLQQLQLELKLNVVLNDQLAYLEDWAKLESNHSTSLAGAINDLESSTLRLPVTSGARADILSLKAAINSAVDVMQTIASSIHSVLPKVEGTNFLASELAELTTQERAMLDECEAMLASTAALQVEEYSLRSQVVQQIQQG